MKPALIIVGGGLAGCLAALALAQRQPGLEFLLIEQEERFGGNHVWSFFDSDVEGGNRWLVEPIVTRHWPEHEIRFPKRSRTIGIGYNSIRSEDLDLAMRERIVPGRFRLGRGVRNVAPDHVVLDDGERIDGHAVVDARGPRDTPGLELCWQKFVGRTYRVAGPHGCERPIIMDATVAQDDGYRFVYTLPFSDTELMVEDTYYSTSPDLDVPGLQHRILGYLAQQGWGGAELISEETGVLPVLLAGRFETLWHADEPEIARLGLAGGFFHPTTGYSLPDAVRNATLLAEQQDFSGASLHRLFRDRAARLWEERHFYQLLNRMLFHAAAPEARYRVLEHFYRLPEPVIGRFYAGELTAIDKLRILSGRPPVPIGKAIAAMRKAS